MGTRLDLKALDEGGKKKPPGFTLLSPSTSKQTLIKFAHPQKHLITSQSILVLMQHSTKKETYCWSSNKNHSDTCKVADGESGVGCSAQSLMWFKLVGKGKHATAFVERWNCPCIHPSHFLDVSFFRLKYPYFIQQCLTSFCTCH